MADWAGIVGGIAVGIALAIAGRTLLAPWIGGCPCGTCKRIAGF